MTRSGGAPEANGAESRGRDHLTRFVRDYLARTGDSVRALARRSRDPQSGITLKHGWLNEIVNNERELPPDLRRLRALAAGMSVPEARLAELAAAQWLGVDVTRVDVAAERVDGVFVTTPRPLSAEERERLTLIVQDIARHFGS